MKSICLKYVLGLFCLSTFIPLQAQSPESSEGVLCVPLQTNPALNQGKQVVYSQILSVKKENKNTTPLTLPFFDDFSYNGPYPDSRKWIDNKVFINNTFPFYPPTQGVATFDALDERGVVYTHAIPNRAFSADTLTSMPIRLDSIFYPEPRKIGIEDSIILSFYCQPGGGWGNLWDSTRRGNGLSEKDMLILEFYSQELGVWVPMWMSDGATLKEFCPLIDSVGIAIEKVNYFRRMDVRLTVVGFNKKDFQFRFRSYSTINTELKTGGGQWHIDYVYLNYGRTEGDAINDVGFVYTTPSLTVPYTRIPYKHFLPSMLRNNFKVQITNLSNQILSCRYRYRLSKKGDTTVLYAQPASGEANANIYPFLSRGYTTDPDLSVINYDYPLPEIAVSDSALVYQLEHVVKSGIQQDFNASNDTLKIIQPFADEFAYDDGSAEAGIGLTYSDGAMASLLVLDSPDTLTALRVFFNDSYLHVNDAAFQICVWEALENDAYAGSFNPGKMIYKSDYLRTVMGEGLNKFYTYNLGEEGLMLDTGEYFVGIQQAGKTYLNIGFDQNTNARNYTQYYYWDALLHEWYWKQMMYQGSLMIRPAFGMAARRVNKEEIDNQVEAQEDKGNLHCKVYPNPVGAQDLHISLPLTWKEKETQYSLSSITGQVFCHGSFVSRLSMNGFPSGVYVLKLYHLKTGQQAWAKVVVKP